MSRAPRVLALVSLGLAVVAAGACGRLGRGGRPASPPASTTPPRADTAAVARVPDSTARRPDSARVDSTRRADSTRTDSTRADSARRAAAGRPRRREPDPASRCGRVGFNEDTLRDPATSRLQNVMDANGKYIVFVGGGVVARCSSVNNTLRADSSEYYETNGFLVLIGNVVYTEPRRVNMTSQRLTYYLNEERLLAEGNVVVTTPSGTTMTGPTAEYMRAVPPIRDRSRLTANGRPTLRVVDRGSSGAAPRTAGQGAAAGRNARPTTGAATATPPAAPAPAPTRDDTATITANTIVNEADSLVFASGQVQIVRSDVTATSDSATFDQGTELARLIRNASIQGTRGRKFTLSGGVVDLYSRERELTRVVSKDSAKIVSEDLDLRSDTVDMRLNEGRVERAFAWGPSRATAKSPDRDVIADSIDAVLPEQRIRELRAVRRAVARSLPDTTKIRTTERDVLSGDTILAHFDSIAARRDTTKTPPPRQIVASGNASALYHLQSGQGDSTLPAINYVRGRLITVDFDTGLVQTVTISDSAYGVYLEPSSDTSSDTTARRPARRANPNAPQGGRGGRQTTPPRPGATRVPDDAPAGSPDASGAAPVAVAPSRTAPRSRRASPGTFPGGTDR